MEKDDVFKFEDFLSGSKLDDLMKMKSELQKEGLFNESNVDDEDDTDLDFSFDDSDEEINQDFNPYNTNSNDDFIEQSDLDEDDVLNKMKRYGWGDLTGVQMEEFENSDEYSGTKDSTEYAEEFNQYLKGIAFTADDEDDDIYEESKSHNEDESYVLYKDKAEEFVCDIAIEGVSQKDTEVRLIVESSDWTLMFKGEVKNGKCVIPLKKLAILNEGQRGNIKLEVNADGNLFTPWEDEFIVKVSKKVTVSVNESKRSKKSMVKTGPGVKVNVKKKRP